MQLSELEFGRIISIIWPERTFQATLLKLTHWLAFYAFEYSRNIKECLFDQTIAVKHEIFFANV